MEVLKSTKFHCLGSCQHEPSINVAINDPAVIRSLKILPKSVNCLAAISHFQPIQEDLYP